MKDALLAANLEVLRSSLTLAALSVAADEKEEALHAIDMSHAAASRILDGMKRAEPKRRRLKPQKARSRNGTKRVPLEQRKQELVHVLRQTSEPQTKVQIAERLGVKPEVVGRALTALDDDLLNVVKGATPREPARYSLRESVPA